MAKSFNSLKSNELGELDKLTFGKFKDCRIIDLIPENYEYLIFLEKSGIVKYNKGLIEKIKQKAIKEGWERHNREEVDPYKDDYNESDPYLEPPYPFLLDSDIPF